MTMPSFYELLKYAKTGVASSDMTAYDKMRAIAIAGGAKYPIRTITGVPPLSFLADGRPLQSWSISGGAVQDGVPAPDDPIYPKECGNLVETGEHAGQYAIPVTVAGQTQTIYLSEPLRKIEDYADSMQYTGQAATRKVKKLVLTGLEAGWGLYTTTRPFFYCPVSDTGIRQCVCSHFDTVIIANNGTQLRIYDETWSSTDAFKQYLSDQYTADTPVTIWYVLSTPTTEPVTIPPITTVRGSNVLTVDTTVQPSSVTITGHIKPAT